MKTQQREPYLEMLRLVDGYGLCNFCKFAEWDGWSCCEMDLDCKHPLGERYGFPEPADVWGDDSDCWGFRPNTSLHEVAQYVSIWTQGNIAHKNKKGEIVMIIPSQKDRELYDLV